MRDPRLDKLARVLVHYSTQVKPGQIVRITGDPVALPLLEAIYEEVLRAGAHPHLKCAPDSLQEAFFELANDEQLQYVSPLAMFEVQNIDASIGVWAETNTRHLSRVDPKRQSKASAARKPIFKVFMERAAAADTPTPGVKPLRWVGTLFPTAASAQDAERSLRQYEDFVFNAGHLDKDDPVAEWRKIKERQQRLVDYLKGKKVVRFQTPAGTDLTVNVEGMKWINCCGECNFPDGEVFTGPNLKAADGGANGVVPFSFPAVHHGREVHDITLRFEKGKVVEAHAAKNQEFLIEMIDQDAGARFVGEIALGTNFQVQEFTRNTLFDEKIGGTFHLAVGAGYPETGNSNESGLHWDMVCDLRKRDGDPKSGGTISVDGEVILRDGEFVFPDWPGHD